MRTSEAPPVQKCFAVSAMVALLSMATACGVWHSASTMKTQVKRIRRSQAIDVSSRSPRTWKVGAFVVREFPLPSDFFGQARWETVDGPILLTVGKIAPYSISWRSLASGESGTVTPAGCPKSTTWAYLDHNSIYPPDDAALVCVGDERSQLTIVDIAGMKVSTFPLPGHPPKGAEYVLNALGFGWPSDPHLWWTVQQSEGDAPLLGSGVFDMTTGTNTPAPDSFDADLYVAPNGTLYSVRGKLLSEWEGKAFQSLGTLSNPRVDAVADDGAVWADQPDASNLYRSSLIRETPNSAKTQSWTVVGNSDVFGPGFVVWQPTAKPELKIFFPGIQWTLTFAGVLGEPLVYSDLGGANYQVTVHTRSGPAVIEVIPPS